MISERTASSRKTRVLVLAWGFSIHAKRRIQLFIDDPEFEVAVVSTHDYNFENAENILLPKQEDGNNEYKETAEVNFLPSISNRILSKLRSARKEIRKEFNHYGILKKAVMRFKPDLVFLQTLLYPCYLALFLPKSIPLAITFWNGDILWWAKWNGIERLLKKQIVTYGVRRARAITVNSTAALTTCIGYGVDAGKVHLIRYPGVDLAYFRPLPRDDARKKLGICSQKVVLCPRGVGGYVNSDIVVEAAVSVIKRYPNTLFVFLRAYGDDLAIHQQFAKEHGIHSNFRWEGAVSWEDMPMYYSASDIMVSISSNDSLPNCMLEAMACAVPVVMGDIPQLHEWVLNGDNGFLVPTRDSQFLASRIIQILENNEGFTESFISKNLNLVETEVDSRKNIRKVKDLVKQIVGNKQHERKTGMLKKNRKRFKELLIKNI